MQVIMGSLGAFWSLLKAAKFLVLISLLMASIGINVAQFTGGVVASALDTAVKSTTGLTSVTSKTKLKLSNTKATAARLTKQVSSLTASKQALESSIRGVSRKLSIRAGLRGGRIAAAGASQAAGSWVPYLGTATGAAFITYEAYDLCQSFKEIHELEQLVSLSPTNDDYVFCGFNFSDQSKPVVSGLNTVTLNGQEFTKIWRNVPDSIKEIHKEFDPESEPDTEFYLWIEVSENKLKKRTWLVDLDIGPDDFYVSEWQ